MFGRTHNQCGHILMYCDYCDRSGCRSYDCEYSICNGSVDICKHCGMFSLVTMDRKNELQTNRNRETVKHNDDVDKRLNDIEKQVRYSSSSSSSSSGTGVLIFLAFLMLLGRCQM